MNRRDLLARGTLAGLGAVTLAALPPALREALAAAAGPPLIERNLWPRQWETSIAALDRSPLTENELFFVRSHLPTPSVDPLRWRLAVHGRVERPLSITLAEMRAMPQHEITCVLECAGNGRGLYSLPNTSGTQWEHGAVGNARWRGVRLAEVLERAGVPAGAGHVWLEAADRSPFGKVPPFLRSIPAAKARDDVLLALEMNGEPLPPLHGAPCRAVVPGWYGMASTKWLTGLRVEDHPSDNHFMARGYRYQYPDSPSDTPPAPVEDIHVKSLITSVREGEEVRPGPLKVAGWAWSGRAITRVEISADLQHWQEAHLAESLGEHAWRRWEAGVEVPPSGTLTVAARATDASGATQPPAARPNPAGYANNSIHRVTLHARG